MRTKAFTAKHILTSFTFSAIDIYNLKRFCCFPDSLLLLDFIYLSFQMYFLSSFLGLVTYTLGNGFKLREVINVVKLLKLIADEVLNLMVIVDETGWFSDWVRNLTNPGWVSDVLIGLAVDSPGWFSCIYDCDLSITVDGVESQWLKISQLTYQCKRNHPGDWLVRWIAVCHGPSLSMGRMSIRGIEIYDQWLSN